VNWLPDRPAPRDAPSPGSVPLQSALRRNLSNPAGVLQPRHKGKGVPYASLFFLARPLSAAAPKQSRSFQMTKLLARLLSSLPSRWGGIDKAARKNASLP